MTGPGSNGIGPRHRQEVYNVVLSQELQRLGLTAEPEVIARRSGSRSLPDCTIELRGLRVMVEAEVGDAEGAFDRAIQKARQRVERGLAHAAVAVVYPASIRNVPQTRLAQEFRQAHLQFAVVTEALQEPQRLGGPVQALAEVLRSLPESIGREEPLESAVALLEAAIDAFVGGLGSAQGVVDRFAVSLGVGGGAPLTTLTPRERLAVRRIAALVIANAMIFHEVLSAKEKRVQPLHALGEAILGQLLDTWRMVVKEIDYYPIFHVAAELLDALPHTVGVAEALGHLRKAAQDIASRRGALRHDLMGRIYHRLLSEAKYLGAYYTSIPAATLLLKLALSSDRWPGTKWSDVAAIGALRIADLACGTGTLLMAAADVLEDNYVRACVRDGVEADLDACHRAVFGEAILGFDVLPSAIHLTASTLALRNPEVMVDNPKLWCLELGGDAKALGSIDFAEGRASTADLALFRPEATRVGGRKGPARESVELPALDLCVMNPPFTRSVGCNLLFGSMPPSERASMRKRLQEVVRRQRLPANITAGLGAVFVAVADRHVPVGGRQALVLPRAVLSGPSWAPTRRLLAENYHLEYIVVSHEPGRWNFSENTNLSEALLVARRLGSSHPTPRHTVMVNLWANPRNTSEALELAWGILSNNPPLLGEAHAPVRLRVSGRTAGEAIRVDLSDVDDLWSQYCAFAQFDLLKVLYHLRQGLLYVPTAGVCCRVPLVHLGAIASIGPDRHGIENTFRVETHRTPYAALWGHDTEAVACMCQRPNAYLAVRADAVPSGRVGDADRLWRGAAELLVAERLRANTARVAAVCVSRRVLSNVWWSVRLRSHLGPHGHRILALWTNSTLGLLLLLGWRTETEGSWCALKKSRLSLLPVLDVCSLSEGQRRALLEAYERLRTERLGRLAEVAHDPVRRAIDDAIAAALGLPDLSPLREVLSWEPLLCLSTDRLLGHVANQERV